MAEMGHNRAKEIFLAALELPEGPCREALLEQTCGRDTALSERVKSLLREHQRVGSFMEEPLALFVAPATQPFLEAEEPGKQIGRYKLLEQIGEGGCGVVYRAEQQEPIRRRVALKIIKLGMDTRQVVARFEAERQALALMDHPNIAKVLDAGSTQAGRPYFVMELVEGVKITEYCDQNKLSVEERLRLFIKICHAIQHAHQKGIIHRDLKPSNILVTMTDGEPVPKVIDFGIAKAVGQQLTEKTIITGFQVIGTPAYMSPEQAMITGMDIDTRSDIYALGVLLYELLSGHPPFDQKELVASGLDEMRRIISEQEPVRPSTRIGALAEPERAAVAKRRGSEPTDLIDLISGDLDCIVMRCLEKDRARRYETAASLAEDLLRHQRDEPVLARSPSRVDRLQKLIHRNKLAFGAAAAVLVTLTLGLSVSTWLLFKERAAERLQKASQRQALLHAKKSETVAQVWKEMLQGVGPAVAMGRDTRLLREILEKTSSRIGKDLKEQPEVEAELRGTLGDVYQDLGDHTNALKMHLAALSIRTNLFGKFHTNVADSLFGVGVALLSAETVDQAEVFLQDALKIRTGVLGPEHAQIAATLGTLGHARLFQHRDFEAEDLLRRALAMQINILGRDNVQVAKNLGYLTVCFLRQDRPSQAEQAAREALSILSRLPENEAAYDKLIAQFRLVDALCAEQKFEEAEREARENLKSLRAVVGPEHTLSVQSLNNLVRVLTASGKLDEGLVLAKDAVATAKRVFGSNYPTPACLANLGLILRKAGKLAEAKAACCESLALWQQEPAVLADEIEMRWMVFCIFREQGKISELESFFRENVAAQNKLTTKVARQREVGLLRYWADLLCEQGKVAEAESLYLRGLEISQKFAVNDFWTRQWLAMGMSELRKNQGRLTEAEEFARQALEFARKSTRFSEIARALVSLGLVLKGQGNSAEAERLYGEAIDACKKSSDLGELVGATGCLADLLSEQGNHRDAEALYHQALEINQKFFPEDSGTRKWLVEGLDLAVKAKASEQPKTGSSEQ